MFRLPSRSNRPNNSHKLPNLSNNSSQNSAVQFDLKSVIFFNGDADSIAALTFYYNNGQSQ